MSLISDKTIYIENIHSNKIKEIFQLWSTQHPKGGVLALVAEANPDLIDTIQSQANANGYPVVGAIFPELIVEGVITNHGALLIHFEHMPAYTIMPFSSDLSDFESETSEIISNLNIGTAEEQTLFMIFDAMVPNISSIIETIYLKIGDVVNYTGANAGSEKFVPIDCIFDNKKTIGNAVLAMLLPRQTAAIIEHGYTKPDTSISATSTTGNRISSIDWRPAFDVYKELAYKHYGIEITVENFYENAVHFPFGIMRMDGEMLVRIPVALEDDGSIFCVGEVPESSILTLLKGVSTDSLKAVDTVVKRIESCEETTMLSFYCAGRRMHLGNDFAQEELLSIHKQTGNKDIIGALSLGEIGGSKRAGYPLFHNAAVLSIPWK